MVSVLSLLIPIALSAVFVFIASSIIHMATPWHRNDLEKLPDEDAVMNALRPLNLPPGGYGFPKPGSMKDMQSPEFQAKHKAGPVAFLVGPRLGPHAAGDARRVALRPADRRHLWLALAALSWGQVSRISVLLSWGQAWRLAFR
jgi:hypothetical protein